MSEESPFASDGIDNGQGAFAPAYNPEPQTEDEPSDEHVAEGAGNHDETPARSHRRGRKRGRKPAAPSEISPDVVDAVLRTADTLKDAAPEDLNLLKLLLGIPVSTGRSKFVAALASRETKAVAVKELEGERDILSTLSDPFAAAFGLGNLKREQRLDHWARLSAIAPEKAKEVAGTDNGRWPNSWRDAQKESQGLYTLYNDVHDSFSGHLDAVKAILDSI